MTPSFVAPLVGYRMQVQTYTGPAGESFTHIRMSPEALQRATWAARNALTMRHAAALTAETIERARGWPLR